MKVISGGQTGVDRAALDAAIEAGLDYGGSVPRGRRAEDGPIDPRYESLMELGSAGYGTRTERNVADADCTLIITRGRPSGGTLLTRRLASARHKPCLVVDTEKKSEAEAALEVGSWLDRLRPEVLNVAGPRESEAPGIYPVALGILRRVLSRAVP